ncbi:MAG: glutamate racemase [Verrucomicrobia bacterium]|nr:MAG: glutamate racemase [Verrucomicrobiota bacterium]
MEAPIKIGMLDSGVGGFSVLREMLRSLPSHPVHYVADNAWCPYGNKPPRDIRRRVLRIADSLIEAGCGIIVVACNSATIHGVELLRASYPLPFVGMEPAVKPAAEMTRSGIVGVLATEASIAGEKFHRLVTAHAQGVRVITRPCPRFVELVEAGVLEGPEAEAVVRAEVMPLLEQGVDVLVLGCTHYPFLRPVMETVVPPTVSILDTGGAVCRRVSRLLDAAGTTPSSSHSPAALAIETTGDLEHVTRLLPLLLPDHGRPVTVRHVDLFNGEASP